MSTLISNTYQGIARSGKVPVLAVAFSLVFHAALLTGFNQPHPKVKAGPTDRPDPTTRLVMVDLKDDPDPSSAPKALDDPPAGPTVPVPMLPETPPITRLRSEFTQDPDPVPLQTGDLTHIVSIPTNIQHRPESSTITKIFNPDDLDKKPEPISQPSPSFPYGLQREVSEATVLVGFIVNNRGDVVQARIISSSHPGFERAALSAIEKWKFRPGLKLGQKVNTRVEQPLAFVLKEDR